jgi:hypothetical protein
MNNFALLAAGRVAHLKVVMVALILATLVEWGYALVVLSEQTRPPDYNRAEHALIDWECRFI